MEQKNFEAFKVWFLNVVMDKMKAEITDSKIRTNIKCLINGTFAISENSFHSKQFLNDFNKFLDNMDIRAVAPLLNRLKTDVPQIKIPKKYNNFTIDYNSKGFLDLIFLK